MMEFYENNWPFLLAGFFAAVFIWRVSRAWVAFNGWLDRLEGRESEVMRVLRFADVDVILVLDQAIPDGVEGKDFKLDSTRKGLFIRVKGNKLPKTDIVDLREGELASYISDALNPAGRSSDSPQAGQTSAF